MKFVRAHPTSRCAFCASLAGMAAGVNGWKDKKMGIGGAVPRRVAVEAPISDLREDTVCRRRKWMRQPLAPQRMRNSIRGHDGRQ